MCRFPFIHLAYCGGAANIHLALNWSDLPVHDMMIRGKIVEWQVWKMSQSAYIQLVKGSAASSVTLEDVMNVLEQYREQTSATGQQLDWNYAEMAFPYTIEQRSDQGASWLHLKGNHPDYKHIYHVRAKLAASSIFPTRPNF